MSRVLTNNVNLAYTIESALGTAGTTWYNMEPNDINRWGADITTMSRNPISKNRQREKGTTVDLDSGVDFEHDVTMSAFRDFIEGFAFATSVNADVTGLAVSAATDGGVSEDGFTVAALSAAQADKIEVDTLIWVSGMDTSANNGLFPVATDAASTDTTIEVATGTLTAETGQSGRLSFAGHRIATGDTVTWTWSSGNKEATLNETGVGTALQALGLTVGQMIHVGSIASAGGAIQNAFENSAANDMYGYARVKEFTDADNVVFDKVDAALQFTDSTDPSTAVDLVFGEFIRNVDIDNSAFLERSFQFELESPGLDAGSSEFEYAKGNYCNTVAFNIPLSSKATASFGFVGTDTENPVAAGSRKSGASSATDPVYVKAFNTSADVARLRITEADEDGLTTDFKSLTITLNNNVTPEKIVGTLGGAYMNVGNFMVDIEAQVLFTEGLVINKIRDNEAVTMEFIMGNEDGVVLVDIPSMTIDNGTREFPVNETVLLNVNCTAHQDASLGTSIGLSTIPVPLVA